MIDKFCHIDKVQTNEYANYEQMPILWKYLLISYTKREIAFSINYDSLNDMFIVPRNTKSLYSGIKVIHIWKPVLTHIT